MKYLKLFNENTDNFKEELQDFCDMNLAYLLDEGFTLQYARYNKSLYSVTLIKNPGERHKFTWDEVKDRYIPFLQLLSKRYELIDFSNPYRSNDHTLKSKVIRFEVEPPKGTYITSHTYCDVDQVIKDEPIEKILNGILSITIKVKNKYETLKTI